MNGSDTRLVMHVECRCVGAENACECMLEMGMKATAKEECCGAMMMFCG